MRLSAAGVGPVERAGPPVPRIWGAIALVVAAHVAALAIRPGVSGGRFVATAAPVMAVRSIVATTPVAALAQPDTARAAPAAEASAQAVPFVAPLPEPTQARSAKTAVAAAVAADSKAALPALATPAPAAAAEPALAAAPEYALGIRLDPGPRPLDDIEPDYPDIHLREGTVVLRLLISETGHVDRVDVVRAEPRGIFEASALEAFGKARFAPGLAGGTPVKSQITVEVQFLPINRGARVSGRTY